MSNMLRRAYLRHIIEKYVSKRRHDVYYVHEICMCYMKAMYHRMLQQYNVINIGQMNDRMIIGELIHEGVKTILEYEECYEPEEKCREINNVTICGTCDIYCNGTVIEVKYVSKSEKVIQRQNGETMITPMEHHVEQCRLYGWLYSAKQCVLLYVTPSRIVSVTYRPYCDGEVRQIVTRWLNDKPSPKYEWECRYCQFREICEHAEENS